jgi:putative transposase
VVQWVAQHMRFCLRPVLRPEGSKGFQLLPRHWVVERTFGWLSWSRRLSKDYEESTASSEAMIYVARIRLMLRRLTVV